MSEPRRPDHLATTEALRLSCHELGRPLGGPHGGLANGDPVEVHLLMMKPPATLGARAKGGRRDLCIWPRVVPVLQTIAAQMVADLWLAWLAHPHRL